MTTATAEPLRNYVRIRGRRGRFVEFDFAIGAPDLAVELIMPEPAFREFCATHHAIELTAEQAAFVDSERAIWRYKQVDTGEADPPAGPPETASQQQEATR